MQIYQTWINIFRMELNVPSYFRLYTRQLFEHVEWYSVNVFIIYIITLLVSLDFTYRSLFYNRSVTLRSVRKKRVGLATMGVTTQQECDQSDRWYGPFTAQNAAPRTAVTWICATVSRHLFPSIYKQNTLTGLTFLNLTILDRIMF